MENMEKGGLKNEEQQNVQNFINYMFSSNKFSEKFTENDFRSIRNKIGENGLNKYITETMEYIKKNTDFNFKDFYNKVLPISHSHRRIDKMSNLLGYIINFCRNQGKYKDSNKNNEISVLLNKNDTIVEYLIKNFCNTRDITEFEKSFARIYKMTKGEDNLEKIISCVHSICGYTKNNLSPDDRITLSEKGQVKVDKADDIIRNKYDNFAVNEDEEEYNNLYSPESMSNTVEEILINFFKDHKIKELSEKIKTTKTKTNINNNLFDNQ